MSEAAFHHGVRLRGDAKRRLVAAMFDRVAPTYDTLNLVVSLGQTSLWRRRALVGVDLGHDDRILDVGCGTGSVPRWLRRRHPTIEIEGMDVSAGMLAEAARRDPAGTYFEGDVAEIPRPDDHYALVTSFFTTRNFGDLESAVTEMVRVTRPGGTLLLLDTFPGGPLAPIRRLWMGRIVPRMLSAVTDPDPYLYLADSIEAHVPPGTVASLLVAAGCEEVETVDLSLGAATLVRARPGEPG